MPHSSPAAHQGRGSAGQIFLAAESKWELDHLVYAVDDLQAGIEHFHQLTGVEPCIGGRHEGLGTHNAVFSLGDSQTYFEIIAAGALSAVAAAGAPSTVALSTAGTSSVALFASSAAAAALSAVVAASSPVAAVPTIAA